MSAISEKIVASLPTPETGNRLHYFSGAAMQGKKAPSGFAVRVTSAGTKSFVWFHREKGRPHLETLGRWDENGKGGSLSVLGAIIAANARQDAIRHKQADARPERTRTIEDGSKPADETIGAMLDMYIDRYVEKERKLRGAALVKRTFDRLVKPAIGKIGVYDLRRKHVIDLLDDVADERGPVMADRTLAYVRKAFNWNAIRDEKFNSPIIKGMARTKPKERARKRVLADDELRDLWAALDTIAEPVCYSAFIRTLLLTATRRTEAAAMRWDEIEGSVWTIPAARYKTKLEHTIPLTEAVRKSLGERPKDYAKRPFVFSTTAGAKPFSGYSKAKRLLDEAIAELREGEGRKAMPPWTLHDLRRTARTLMSRANVNSDHAERCLGHVIGGSREVYDRHEFDMQKKVAFKSLDSLIGRILKPAGNVADFAEHRKTAG